MTEQREKAAAEPPLDCLVGRATRHRDYLLRQADEIGAVLRTISPGEQWVDAHSAELTIGTVYVVRRKFHSGGVGSPGLSRWTRNGWHDEFASPLSQMGVSVDVLVPNAALTGHRPKE